MEIVSYKNVGLCQCGCGATTSLATKTNKQNGVQKGDHRRFISGHDGRSPTDETKTCTQCDKEKSLNFFYRLRTSPDGYRESCIACHQKYLPTAECINERRRKHRLRNRNYVLTYLKTHPCIDCGEKDTVVLEFDHVRDIKKSDISRLIGKGAGLFNLQTEMDKCEVVCANCHRRRTARQQGWADGDR